MRLSEKYKKEQNLEILIKTYRATGRAKNGYDKLIRAIEGKRNRYLKRMLRNHFDEMIEKPEEIAFRDEVDYLLKFYSLVEIAILTGFVSPDLTPELREEILTILGNEYVIDYYQNFYEVFLCRILYENVKKNKRQKVVEESPLFIELMFLEKMLDDDVENFLWLLDFGYFGNQNINHLLSSIARPVKVKSILGKDPEEYTEMDSAFFGFIKFTDYMRAYEKLLRSCNSELLRSILWHYQAYWFEQMDRYMGDTYIKAIENITVMTNKMTKQAFLKETAPAKNRELTASQNRSVENKIYSEWKKESQQGVKQAIGSVKYNLNSAHGKALVKLYQETHPEKA